MRLSQRGLILSLCLLAACSRRPLYVQEHHAQQYRIGLESGADSSLKAMLQPYKLGVDTQMRVIIGRTDIPLTKAQPESSLGNFQADAMLRAGRRIDTDVVAAISNYGGLRISYIAPGPISRAKMYELMPFDNMLTIIEIPGALLQRFCDVIAVRKGWPLSGISFSIKDRQAIRVQIGSAALNEGLVYKLAVNDYIARGGDNCDFLQGLKKRVTNVFIRDAMIDYLAALEQQGLPLHPVIQNRIQYAE